MKLNYKRTILVGFAFFLISAFWQAYDATIPVILTNKFGMSQTWSGVIMALDNILAVFMLPISVPCPINARPATASVLPSSPSVPCWLPAPFSACPLWTICS